MRCGWVPERGDLVWLSFSPHAGCEQAGRRPALVLTPANDHAGRAVVCPVTSRVEGYPFEVRRSGDGPVSGVVLVDQMRS